jgi:hypothetical protein
LIEILNGRQRFADADGGCWIHRRAEVIQ